MRFGGRLVALVANDLSRLRLFVRIVVFILSSAWLAGLRIFELMCVAMKGGWFALILFMCFFVLAFQF